MKEKNVTQYPPYNYLAQVAEHHPIAVKTYMDIWNDKDKDNEIHIHKSEIKLRYLISPAKFKNDLFHLVREGLASFNENAGYLHIELVDWTIDAEGYTLC